MNSRSEAIKAGINAAKSQGKTIGGRGAGVLNNHTKENLPRVKQLHAQGVPIARIAKDLQLSRTTIYKLLRGEE